MNNDSPAVNLVPQYTLKKHMNQMCILSISPNALAFARQRNFTKTHSETYILKNNTMINRAFRTAAITAPPETTKVFSRTICQIRTGTNDAVYFFCPF